MGLFGCSHKWSKYGRKVDGYQQRRCRKCGRLQRRKVSQFWCVHAWRMDRRAKSRVLRCRKCGRTRQTRQAAPPPSR